MASKAIGFLNFKFSADLTSFERGMKKAQKDLTKFGRNLKRTGQTLTRSLTLPIIGLGAVAVKTFMDFEQSMLKVKAISGATDQEFKALTESARELGASTMFTASQVSELQLNLSKLGLTPTEINQSTEAILNLAQATDSDLGEAATVTASIMNSFGLEATDMTMISDVMADSFSSTALDLQKFQVAMASVAPVAKQAGADLETTTAVLGVLTNNGIEASTAGTALRNIFLDLANQGLTWDEAMTKINESMNPLQTAMDLFGKRGAGVATIIANNSKEIRTLTADFKDSEGEAKSMADVMDSGLGGSVRKLQSALADAAISLGSEFKPIVEKIIERIQSLVKWFKDLSDEQRSNIVKWALLVATLGPLLLMFGSLISMIGSGIGLFMSLVAGVVWFTSTIKAATGVMHFFNLVMAANPIGFIVTVVAAVVAALIYFSTSASNVAVTVRNAFRTMVNGIIWILNGLIEAYNWIADTLGMSTISKIKKLEKESYKTADAVDAVGDAAERTTHSMKALAEINSIVAKDTKEEFADVAALTSILQDEDSARKDQIKALKELKEISPEYYGDLKIGVSTLDDMVTATDNYTKALLKQAKVEAVQDKIKDVMARKLEYDLKNIELAASQGIQAGTKEYDEWLEDMNTRSSNKDQLSLFGLISRGFDREIQMYKDFLGDMDLADIMFTKKRDKRKKGDGGTTKIKTPFEIDLDELKANHELALNELKRTQLIEQKSQEDFDGILESEEQRHLNNMWNLYNKYGEDVTDIDKQILDKLLANNEKLEEDPFANYRNSLGKLGEKISEFTGTEISELEMGLGDMIEKLAAELAQGADDFEEYGKNVKGVLRDIVGGLISAGVAAAVSKALKDTAFLPVWAIPIVAGAAAGLAKTAFNTLIPEFAQGGLVTGPTTALIGEGIGTTGANPEVVAPLDKLKQYMGGGQNITVEGKLVGNDIYLSNERTKFNRNRTV